MFADVALARRIERAEAVMSAEIVSAVQRKRPPDLAFVEPVGSGYAVYGGPGSPFSKVIGVGLDPTLDLDALARAEHAFEERGSSVRAEVCVLAHPDVFGAFADRGYVFQTVEHVLGCRLAGATGDRTAPPGIDISLSGPENAGEWIRIVVDGFVAADVTETGVTGEEFPRDVLERVFSDYEALRMFRRYLASVDGAPAGGASLCIVDDIALLSGASTLPAFRRRGVQTALLRRRLADAAAEGCALAVVTTAPGSMSQQNVVRQGFALLYARAVMTRPAD